MHSSGQVPCEYKLCCCNQIGHEQVVSNKFYSTGKRGNMAISNCNGTKEKWELWICVDFCKLNVVTKYSYPLPFIDEKHNIVVGHEVYLFLDGYFGYHWRYPLHQMRSII